MTGSGTRQLLLIENDAELYGIDAAAVQEIRGYQPLTRLPHAPIHVSGILNAGGRILPIIDLRCILWGQHTEASAWHVIVIVKDGDAHCGILVDAAKQIMDFGLETIEPIPAEDSLFEGIATVTSQVGDCGEQPVPLLDIAAISRFQLQTSISEPIAREGDDNA